MYLESSEARWASGLVYWSDTAKDLVLSFSLSSQCQLYPQATPHALLVVEARQQF